MIESEDMARAWIGTSGFDYKEWKPEFYPPDLPHEEFLRYYTTRLNSVEINNTFYQMPNPGKIAAWRDAVPDGFRFSLKVSRKITHQERLKVPSDALDYLLATVRGLETRLGVLLFQFPPYLRCDVAKLEGFLGALPRDLPAAFEFRHGSWFRDEVYRALESGGAALCINDSDDGTTPMRVTGRLVYVRLRRADYPAAAFREWQETIRGWIGADLDVFAYIKHEENPGAPGMAVELAAGI